MSRHPVGLDRLSALVARLRGPEGCPWDREQRLEDLRTYLLEEAHETAAAIDHGAGPRLAEELGDLVFLVAFVAGLAEEEGAFTLAEVVEGAEAKIVARHPHVFGGERLEDARAVRRAWEERKARQKEPHASHLDGVPDAMPALAAAYRITQKAAGVGFDWPEPAAVLEKIAEETRELAALLEPGAAADRRQLREETGDLLFAVANLARKLEIDPEAALARANRKFRRRFAWIERRLAETGKGLAEATLQEMDRLWDEAKETGAPESPTTGASPRSGPSGS